MYAVTLFGAHVSEEVLHGMEHSVTLICRLTSVELSVSVYKQCCCSHAAAAAVFEREELRNRPCLRLW